MVMSRLVTLAALGLLADAASAAGVVYQNDFATRTSASPMPRADWFVKDYVYPAALAYSYSALGPYGADLPYANTERVQDGWAKVYGANAETQLVNYWVRLDPGQTNPFACFSNQTGQYGKKHEVMMVHSLNNDFTSGKLRISADLRCPNVQTDNFKEGYYRFKVLFKDTTNPGSPKYVPYALAFGFNGGDKASVGQVMSVGSNGEWANPTTEATELIKTPDRSHWYRFVADINLNNSTYTCSAYDMGTEQPTLDTATPAQPTGTSGTHRLYRRVSDAGPVSGIGLHMRYMSSNSAVSSTDSTVSTVKCPVADNIRCWWKPADRADDFTTDDLVYENDFATRKTRFLAGSASSAATAEALALPESCTYSYWNVASTEKVGSDARNLISADSTTGRDGWRKVDGDLRAILVDSETAAGNVIAIATSGGSGYSRFAQPIGASVSSGKIKATCDLKVPKKWYSTSRTFTLCLGNGALATTANEGYAIRVGLGAGSSAADTAFYPYVYEADPRVRTETPLESNKWYRVSVVADLAARTFDYNLYSLPSPGGIERTDAELVKTMEGLPFDAKFGATDALSTLAIYSFGSGSSFASAQLVDNIVIATSADGESWTDLYRNNFTTCVRSGTRTTREAKLLTAEMNRIGHDGWIRRGKQNYTGDWIVREIDGDPCLAYEDEARGVHATHILGNPIGRGKFTFRADVRPPSRCCSGMSTQTVRFYLGGDEYAQGEVGTYTATSGTLRSYLDATIGNFGLAPRGSTDDIGYVSRYYLVVTDRDGTQQDGDISGDARNKWYRFVATVDMDRKTWQVDVYDQGTTRPTVGTANGTPVKSFTDLQFKTVDPSGVTALGLAAGAAAGLDPNAADTKGLLVDNIVVETRPIGLIILLR